MKKIHQEKLYKQFEVAAENAWNWLREFKPYREAYAEYSRRVASKRAIPFFATSGEMFFLRSDYELSRKGVLKCLEYQDRVNSVWRFYPLLNPNNKKMPEHFLLCLKVNFLDVGVSVEPLNDLFHNLVESDNSLRGLKYIKHQIIELIGMRSKRPSRLVLSINLSRNRDTIKKEVFKIVSKFQNKYKFRQTRPSFSELDLRYKAKVLRALGKTHKQIAVEIFPAFADVRSACKRVARLLS